MNIKAKGTGSQLRKKDEHWYVKYMYITYITKHKSYMISENCDASKIFLKSLNTNIEITFCFPIVNTLLSFWVGYLLLLSFESCYTEHCYTILLFFSLLLPMHHYDKSRNNKRVFCFSYWKYCTSNKWM